MSRRASLALLMLAGACTPPVRVSDECRVPPESRAEYLKFVRDCAEAANPKSDEEGEDLVEQCAATGSRTFEVCRPVYEVCDDGSCPACDLRLPPSSVEACRAKGWKP